MADLIPDVLLPGDVSTYHRRRAAFAVAEEVGEAREVAYVLTVLGLVTHNDDGTFSVAPGRDGAAWFLPEPPQEPLRIEHDRLDPAARPN